MTPLASYLVSAMLAWVPLSAHASFERGEVTARRYAAIAEDIATVALERPAVDGDPARTGLVLAALASYESAFAARVDDCRTPGGRPGERAWSIWQVEGDRVELCASRLAAARAARAQVEASIACAWGDRLALYATGKCGRSDKARWRWHRAHAWWLSHLFGVEPTS